MASVRMTISLRDVIHGKGHSLFNNTIEKSQVLPEDFAQRLWTEINDHLFTKLDVAGWPASWCMESERFQVRKLKGVVVDSPMVDTAALSYSYNSPTMPKFRTPLIKPIMDWNSNICLNSFTPSDELFQILYKQRVKTAKVHNEQRTFCAELKSTLARCNTLKQFLDAWPHGESLIDDDIMAQHNAATEKKVRAEVVAPDVSATMSSILLKRTLSG